MKTKLLYVIVTCILSVNLFLPLVAHAENRKPVKNVILFIGDGMGPTHVILSRYYSLFVLGKELNMTRAMNNGSTAYMTTYSLKHLVSDSASAATAMATGYKTSNGMISMTPDGVPRITILEKAYELKKSAGLVTVTRITHATPAAFASHIDDRDKEADIAIQMLKTGVDVMLGGGLQFFIPRHEKGSKRSDDQSLLETAQQIGYTIVKDATDLRTLETSKTKKLLGLFKDGHMSYNIDRDNTKEPSLVEMTKTAIEILEKNNNGFFLMVEGGLIDQAAHQNDAASTMREVLEFDQAIGVGLEYTKKNQDTLLVVTGDHETGGIEITKGNLDKGGMPENYGNSSEYMTLNDLRLLGKSKSSFEKMRKNIETADSIDTVKTIVEDSTGIDITLDKARMIKENNPVSKVMDKPGNVISKAIADELSIQWSTAHHGAEPLMLFAVGPYSEKFKGFLDNTDVAKLISQAFQIGY